MELLPVAIIKHCSSAGCIAPRETQRQTPSDIHHLHRPPERMADLVEATLALLVSADLEVLAALDGVHVHLLAGAAGKTKDNLLGGLSLLVEDGLGLTTESGLLAVVTALTLGVQRGLASLVLGDLVHGVLPALLGLAVSLLGLGNVHHLDPTRKETGISSLRRVGR